MYRAKPSSGQCRRTPGTGFLYAKRASSADDVCAPSSELPPIAQHRLLRDEQPYRRQVLQGLPQGQGVREQLYLSRQELPSAAGLRMQRMTQTGRARQNAGAKA